MSLCIYHCVFVCVQFLADLETNPLLRDSVDCQRLLMEGMKYHLLPQRRPLLQSPRTRPRKATVGAMFAVGGMDATKGSEGRFHRPTHKQTKINVSTNQLIIDYSFFSGFITCNYDKASQNYGKKHLIMSSNLTDSLVCLHAATHARHKRIGPMVSVFFLLSRTLMSCCQVS